MDITYAQLSSPGKVRPNNEDFLGFWQPDDPEEKRSRGAAAVIADGMGGQESGEVASHLAVEAALRAFCESKPNASPNQLLFQIFNAANLAVYDAGMADRAGARMGTTLTVSIFRNNEVCIGHVGDCRVYVISNGAIRRITSDHSYANMQIRLGLLSEREAMASPLRSVLTRCVGKDPTIRADYLTVTVNRGDRIVTCTDGLYCYLTEQEVQEIGSAGSPEEACRKFIALGESRGGEDNLSVQVVQIEKVEQLAFYRGLPVYHKAPEMPSSNEVQVGQILDGRFQISDLISRSGMASIFRAEDFKTGKSVAIKVPFMQFESDPGFFQRFEREEQIGTRLNHPSILHMETVEQKSRPYIVMEYLEGQTLGQIMRTVSPMPVADALKIASRLCDALDYMHRNDVIHRDLKPENVMVCEDGSLRIMDFGIAKVAGQRRLTFSGFSPAVGTPDYMAPEQVKGKRGDNRTDIYSLGAILYEMVTGSPPFEGANAYMIMNARLTGDPVAPRKHNPQITPHVEEIILHAMERNPWDRYATAGDFKADLDDPDRVEVTGRATRLREPAPWKARWRTLRIVLLAVLVPVALVILFIWLGHRH